MPRIGKIRQFLDGLCVADLRAIRREFAPQVIPYGKDGSDKDALIRRLRRSLKGSISRTDLSLSDLVGFAIRDAKTRDRRNNTTIIEETLENIVFSRYLFYKRSKNIRERWICGETFQSLRMAFSDHPHTTVCVEQSFGRLRVDVCVTARDPENGSVSHYPIEVKRTSKTQNIKPLPRQLDNYRKCIKPRPAKIYVFVVADTEGSLQRTIVQDKLNGARRRKDTKVIVKEHSDVQRDLSSR